MNANANVQRRERQGRSLRGIPAPVRRVGIRRPEPCLRVAPSVRAKARHRSDESAKQRRQGDG